MVVKAQLEMAAAPWAAPSHTMHRAADLAVQLLDRSSSTAAPARKEREHQISTVQHTSTAVM